MCCNSRCIARILFTTSKSHGESRIKTTIRKRQLQKYTIPNGIPQTELYGNCNSRLSGSLLMLLRLIRLNWQQYLVCYCLCYSDLSFPFLCS